MQTLFATVAFATTSAVAHARSSDAARGAGVGRGFLAAGMRPAEVARSFLLVENDWRAQASMFADCNNATDAADDNMVDCHSAPMAFAASCNTVVKSTIAGSSGDRRAVREYLNDVCGQGVLKGWRAERCKGLASGIVGSMSADTYSNRDQFDSAGVCSRFWAQFLAVEQERVGQEQIEREQQAKEAEEQRKTQAEEAEKEAEKERETAALQAEKQAEEERKAAEESNRAAEQTTQEATKKISEDNRINSTSAGNTAVQPVAFHAAAEQTVVSDNATSAGNTSAVASMATNATRA